MSREEFKAWFHEMYPGPVLGEYGEAALAWMKEAAGQAWTEATERALAKKPKCPGCSGSMVRLNTTESEPGMMNRKALWDLLIRNSIAPTHYNLDRHTILFCLSCEDAYLAKDGLIIEPPKEEVPDELSKLS